MASLTLYLCLSLTGIRLALRIMKKKKKSLHPITAQWKVGKHQPLFWAQCQLPRRLRRNCSPLHSSCPPEDSPASNPHSTVIMRWPWQWVPVQRTLECSRLLSLLLSVVPPPPSALPPSPDLLVALHLFYPTAHSTLDSFLSFLKLPLLCLPRQSEGLQELPGFLLPARVLS